MFDDNDVQSATVDHPIWLHRMLRSSGCPET